MMLPETLLAFLTRGGPVLWIIAGLSVLTLALILWKLWQLARLGAWGGSTTQSALDAWAKQETDTAIAAVTHRRSLRARLALAAMRARLNPALTDATAREVTGAQARADLVAARQGLRALELIATTAPLLGLLGTVLGMIDAFQTLQDAGNRADPAALAGGIWEALLTTAAGMAVAIPAGVALTWFESIAANLQQDMEATATRVFTEGPGAQAPRD